MESSSGEFSVSFSLPEAGPVDGDVFDVAGRAVLHQRLEQAPAGESKWNASRARSLTPGIYLVRLRWRDQTRLTKAAVVR